MKPPHPWSNRNHHPKAPLLDGIEDRTVLDLHNHILPGIDDGPTSMAESLEMARVAYEDGIRTLVATPHSHDVAERSSLADVKALLGRLRQELWDRSIPLKLLLGMENHLDLDIPEQVDRGLAIPVEGTHYILVELPFQLYPPYAEDVLFQLRLKGLRPIIAHPERNDPIRDNPQVLANLVQKGVLSQLTAASIAGDLGGDVRKLSHELLHRGLVHIIASDGHTPRGSRRPLLSPGVAAAAGVVGRQAALRMVEDTPRAILRDEQVDPEEPSVTPARKRRWWPLRR